LSYCAIARALRDYSLHPDQLSQPRPYQPLSSPHPNWCFQVDASVCVVFYLPQSGKDPSGYCLAHLDKKKHYKNRPDNVAAIERFRVIRYVATDHASGVIRVRYYPHSESAEHTVSFLAWLMAPKNNPSDPFHGAPRFVMVDPGATSAGMVRRFCEALDIVLIVNESGNPRAKGSVEKANDLWEKEFEAKLRFIGSEINDFDDLNALAEKFQLFYNATEVHTRHRETRFGAWMKITPEQLRVTAPATQLLRVATGKALTPQVRASRCVHFDGRVWDVSHVPGINIGATVDVALSPFTEGGAVAIVRDDDGRVQHLPLTAVDDDTPLRFDSTAATIGEEYKSPPDTPASANAKEISMRVSGAKTLQDDAAARRKKDFVPFGGEFNPFAAMEKTTLPEYMPRTGNPLGVTLPAPMPRTLTAARAAMQAREALGEKWNEGMFEFITRRWSAGVNEEELARQIARWQALGVGEDAITKGD
jgi:hypothetical protein